MSHQLSLSRRSKSLIFDLATPQEKGRGSLQILGHLGMTGRMFLQPLDAAIPKHTVLHFSATGERFVFQDVRRFGRFTRDLSSLQSLGPEPWDAAFTPRYLRELLQKSKQAIKVRLLDQSTMDPTKRRRPPLHLNASWSTTGLAARVVSAIR